MDTELKRIADDLDKVAALFARLDDRFAPVPHTGTPPVYLSGRWKLRDGVTYGR